MLDSLIRRYRKAIESGKWHPSEREMYLSDCADREEGAALKAAMREIEREFGVE